MLKFNGAITFNPRIVEPKKTFWESFKLVLASCLNLTGLILMSLRYWRASRRLFRESFRPVLEFNGV